MRRNELLKEFEDGGFILMNVMGILENENVVSFFLDKDEKIDARAISFMKDWGECREEPLYFDCIRLQSDEGVIRDVADEWFENNWGVDDIEECIMVIFNK